MTEEVAAVVTVEEEVVVEEEVCTYDARRVHAETGVARWCLATRVAAHTLGDTLCRRAACSDCMHTPLAACPSTRTRIRPRHRHSSTRRRRRGERSFGLGDVRPRRLVVPAAGASTLSSLAWKCVGLLTLPPIPEALIPLPTVPRQGTAGRSRAWAVSMSSDAVVGASRRACLYVELVGGVDRNRSRYRIRSQQQLLVSEFLLISIASVDRRL